MAIGRISGAMLKANLERQGTDLAVETDLLYIRAMYGLAAQGGEEAIA